MEIFNRDISPSEEFIAAYPELEFFAANPTVARAFAAVEAKAVFWKRWHSRIGTASLICVALMMWVLDYQVTLASCPVGSVRCSAAATWPGNEELGWFGESLGVVGILAQIAMGFVGLKERWILARFHAERLRCLKFQAFVFLALETQVEEAERKAKIFIDEAIANLNQELMGGRAAMLQFSPLENARETFGRLGQPRAEDVQRSAIAYRRLRLEVQQQHFEARAHASREADRLPSSAADVAFFAGTLVALAAIVAGGAEANSQSPQAPLFRLATLALFTLSAVLAIYQRGAASKSNAERDFRYAREIERILSRQPPESAARFADTVREMETIVLQELEEYSRSAEMASYLF